MASFSNPRENLVQFTFANGNTVSIAFHEFSYSDKGETTAELAAWNNDRDIPLSDNDDVRGHMTIEEVLEILNQASTNTIPIRKGLHRDGGF